MTYADPYDMTEEAPAVAVDPTDGGQFKRSWTVPVLFMLPLILCGLSEFGGGLPVLTDAGFLALTILCSVFLIRELINFGQRQGIGAILLYGGALVWFCHDYMSYWFGVSFASGETGYSPEVVARAAFYHMLFVVVALIMLGVPFLRWVDRLVVKVPEPKSKTLFFLVFLASFLFGVSPILLFTGEPFYISMFKEATFQGGDVIWAIEGRTGNLNFSFSAYLAQVLQVGQVSGILGAFYAFMITRTVSGKIIGWAAWFFWVSYSFASLRRGDIAFECLPIVGMVFVKYQLAAADQLKKFSLSALVLGGVLGVGLVALVQYETWLRTYGTEYSLTVSRGNTMFSEGLRAWSVIPDPYPFQLDTFPGAPIVRPFIDQLYWFLIDPIPRAIWTTKPIDEFNAWYNDLITGQHNGANGTTVSGGAVCAWYFRYGFFGVIEGAMIYGWLFGIAERSFRRTRGRPMALLFSLAFATFCFRSYRDLWWHNLYPILIAGVVMTIVVAIFNRYFQGDAVEDHGSGEYYGHSGLVDY